MRKIYSLLLMLVMAVGISFHAESAVTVKVNKTGVLYFKSFGPSGETVLDSEVNTLPNDNGGMTVGEIFCPAGYSMTCVNEATGGSLNIDEYDGMQKININPGTAPDGTVLNITVTGGGGGVQIDPNGVNVKVNKTGIVYFQSFGPSGKTVLENELTVLPNDCGGDVAGEIFCPAGYTMTCYNESKGTSLSVDEYDGMQKINVNPGTAPKGTVLNITIAEGGGGGEDPALKAVTFVFSPAGCAYVVTAHANDNGNTVEDDTYFPGGDGSEIEVPFNSTGLYIIKPNSGFTLVNAKDETDTNPHNEGDRPGVDGFIRIQGGMVNAGASIVVTGVQHGSFTVSGVGQNVENIQMMNMSTYEYVTVTAEAKSVAFAGNTQYKIYSSSSSPIWKVEVTDAENYKTELSGNYGNFFYTPNNGDKVVIYTDKPEQHAQIKISFEGEGVNKSIVKKVMYNYTEVDEYSWGSGNWNVIAGSDLVVIFNDAGYVNLNCKVNGVTQTLRSNAEGKYMLATLDNGAQTIKEYNVVISAEKEKTYNVTLVCEHPEAVSVAPMVGYYPGTPLAFTASGQTFTINPSNNQLKFTATNGWKVDGILVDGELPKDGEFYDNAYFVNADCTITINVSNKANTRTKTAVVYVDESVANPMYLDFKYCDQTVVAIKPGYNFVPFGDDDLPFSFGYYAGNSAEFYVNGSKIDSPMSCPQTASLEDGAVIKYFNGTPVAQVVTYSISDEVADLIEIRHDHLVNVDHKATKEYLCFKGTQVHIKPASGDPEAHLSTRSESAPSFTVKVGDTVLQPDADGVYSIVVGDTATAITVSKNVTTGVYDIVADGNEVFDIFNLQGVVVKRNATVEDLESLPSGFYIANGRKVVIK